MKDMIFAVALAMIWVTPALAGVPYQEETECPIGDEKFSYTSTLSCSFLGDRTMGFQAITSCGFIEALPQCPSNKLPLYKEFSDEELAQIESFMNSSEYQDAAKHSRFYLAYQIESQLLNSSDVSKFEILLNGFGEDFERTHNDPDYRKAFWQQYENELMSVSDEILPIARAIGAYYAMLEGDLTRAHAELEASKSAPQDDEKYEFLATYQMKIEKCTEDASLGFCAIDAPIEH